LKKFAQSYNPQESTAQRFLRGGSDEAEPRSTVRACILLLVMDLPSKIAQHFAEKRRMPHFINTILPEAE
jgi:hypothetical protein